MGAGSTRVNRWLRRAEFEPDAYDALCNYLGLDGWVQLGGLILRGKPLAFEDSCPASLCHSASFVACQLPALLQSLILVVRRRRSGPWIAVSAGCRAFWDWMAQGTIESSAVQTIRRAVTCCPPNESACSRSRVPSPTGRG